MDRIRKKTMSSNIIPTSANIVLRAVTSFFRALVPNNNISLSYLSHSFQGNIIPTSPSSNAEILSFMKEERYFNYKRKKHTIVNFPEKIKISAIKDASDVCHIKNVE